MTPAEALLQCELGAGGCLTAAWWITGDSNVAYHDNWKDRVTYNLKAIILMNPFISFGSFHLLNFLIFWPPFPFVRIWNQFWLQNSGNLPYCVRFSMTPLWCKHHIWTLHSCVIYHPQLSGSTVFVTFVKVGFFWECYWSSQKQLKTAVFRECIMSNSSYIMKRQRRRNRKGREGGRGAMQRKAKSEPSGDIFVIWYQPTPQCGNVWGACENRDSWSTDWNTWSKRGRKPQPQCKGASINDIRQNIGFSGCQFS